MRVKSSYRPIVHHLSLAALICTGLTACNDKNSPSAWWREITSQREDQMIPGKRRKPMFNSQFETNQPTAPTQDHTQGYYIPQESMPEESAPPSPSSMATPVPQTSEQATRAMDQPGPWLDMEDTQPAQLAYQPAPVATTNAANMAALAPAAGVIPPAKQRKPIASHPDAQLKEQAIELASIASHHPEYPALSSIPATPDQFETVRQQHPSIKEELIKEQQLSDTDRQRLYQYIATDSDDALSPAFSQYASHEKRPLPEESPAQVSTYEESTADQGERVAAAPPSEAAVSSASFAAAFIAPETPAVTYGDTKITASVDQALVPPPVVPMAIPEPPVTIQPVTTAAAPINAFVQAPTASGTPVEDESNAYVPAVPQYRYSAPRNRGSGYLPDSRY